MDANNKSESVERRREEALARRLGEALDQLDPRAVQACPDAELIAAYHERALAPDETEQCVAHFAACSRCRKILAVLAASDDSPLAETEVARLGGLVAAAQAPSEATSQKKKPVRPNRFDWRMRWLAPALGVAAALAMWFAIRPPWRSAEQGSSGNLIAQIPKSPAPPMDEPPSPGQPSSAAPVEKRSTDSERSSTNLYETQPALNSESPKAEQDALAKKRLDSGAVGGAREAGPESAKNSSQDRKTENSETSVLAGGVAAPPPPPPVPAPSLQAELQTTQPAPAEPLATTNGRARTLAAPAARAPVANKSAAADSRIAAFGASSSANAAKVLTAPSGAVSWRIGPGGRVERSTDMGRTWMLQATPSQQEWLAGAAVSDTGCWIVGRGGAIARTTDGTRWESIASPQIAADASGKYPDWIAITATGAQTATVTASDQRHYSTQDGGRTWQAQ